MYPSHANSSVGQVANAYAGNPQALQQRTQPQNGVTPELIDLLALQKLQAEKESAARQMAMANGQQPPTVAQGLEQNAMQSARQEMAQKLGLPGLMSQGQAQPSQGSGQPPQGAPGIDPGQQRPPQQPMPPTQTMARGGLVRLRSNLPSRYAGGGIVAFDDGGAVEDENGYLPGESFSERLMRRAQSFGSGLKNVLRATANAGDETALPSETADGLNLAEALKNYKAPVAEPSAPGPLPDIDTAVAAAIRGANGDTTLRNKLFTELAKQYNVDALDQAIARTQTPSEPSSPEPQAQPAGGSYGTTTSTRTRTGGIADLAQDTSPLRIRTEKSVTDTMDNTPDSEAARARADYAATTGNNFQALQDAQATGLAKLKELQAKEQAGRPNDFMRGLQLMGRNLHSVGGLGAAFAGVGEGIDATNAGYTQQDIKMQQDLNTLDIAMKKAAQENDIGTYNAANKAREDIMARIQGAQQTAGTLLGHDENARARVDAANARVDSVKTTQQAAEDARMERVLTDVEKATEAQVKSAFTTPEEQNVAYQKLLAQNSRYQALRAKLGYGSSAPIGTSIDLSQWGQPKVKG